MKLTEFEKKLEHILVSAEQDGFGIATGRRGVDGKPYRSRTQEFVKKLSEEHEKEVREASIAQWQSLIYAVIDCQTKVPKSDGVTYKAIMRIAKSRIDDLLEEEEEELL